MGIKIKKVAVDNIYDDMKPGRNGLRKKVETLK